MAITSESQIIDVRTITQGCAIIEEAARDYTTCASKVKEAANICTDKALSVEKKSMQPSINDLGTSIATVEGNIQAFTAQIIRVANQIQLNQYEALREYQEAQAKKAEAENGGNTGSSN